MSREKSDPVRVHSNRELGRDCWCAFRMGRENGTSEQTLQFGSGISNHSLGFRGIFYGGVERIGS